MSTKRVLIIDDEKNLCTVIQACLELLGGWITLVATSSKEGLILAQTEHPDAILLDVMMPDMDGITLFHLLQADTATQSIPVILLTAKVHSIDLKQFSQLSIAGAIAKPFDPLTLSEQVAQTLGWSE